MEQLEQLSLDKSAFVITSVIGQELLSSGCYAISITVLEAALQIGTSSQKLKGSVYSALCSAHWALGHIDQALQCMQEDLDVSVKLGMNVCKTVIQINVFDKEPLIKFKINAQNLFGGNLYQKNILPLLLNKLASLACCIIIIIIINNNNNNNYYYYL